jgi:hypothetical protein
VSHATGPKKETLDETRLQKKFKQNRRQAGKTRF